MGGRVRRRVLAALAAVTLVAGVGVAGAVPASAVDLIEGCSYLDSRIEYGTADIYDGLHFAEGERISVEVSDPNGLAVGAYLRVNNVEVAKVVAIPGVMSYTFPATEQFDLFAAVGGPGGATYSWRCVAPEPPDADGDGVPDGVDLCPDTDLPDQIDELKKNRFAADASGAFVDGAGASPGYTIADTGGCSATQIIEQAGLGHGHARFGISRGELEAWIASLTAVPPIPFQQWCTDNGGAFSGPEPFGVGARLSCVGLQLPVTSDPGNGPCAESAVPLGFTFAVVNSIRLSDDGNYLNSSFCDLQ